MHEPVAVSQHVSVHLVRAGEGVAEGEAECVDDPCVLSVLTSCTTSWDLVGSRTELEVDAWDGVQDAGEDAGY